MNRLKAFVILLVLLPSLLSAQAESEKVKDDLWYANDYFTKSFFSIQQDIAQAQIYADSSLHYAAQIGDTYSQAKFHFLMATMERVRGHYRESRDLFKTFEAAAITQKDTQMLASVTYQLGIVTEALGDLDKAVAYQFQSMDYYEMLGDSISMLNSLNNLGSIHRKLKQYDKSETYYMTALDLNIKAERLGAQADVHINMGNLYAEQGKYSEALPHYIEGKHLDSITNYVNGLGYDYENIGTMYARQKEYDLALANYQQSLAIREKMDQKYELTQIYIRLGELYREINKTGESEIYLLRAKDLTDQTNAAESKSHVYKALSLLYRDRGQYKTAMDYQDQYIQVKDSMLNQNTSDQISKLNIQYETEKKEQEITLLTTEKELANTRLSAARKQLIGLTIGSILVSALMLIIFRLFRKMRGQNVIITKALQEKDILLREIHHRVKNNLQFISSLLGLQSEHISDKVALGALQEGQGRVQSMALIHQNLYQEDNLTGVDMQAYFIKLIRGLFDSYNVRKDQIQLNLEVEDVNLDVDSVIPIGLIVNELVSNALKYAFPDKRTGLITVRLQEIGEKLSLTVHDDGIGITQEQQKSLGGSFGYRLIHVFSEQLQAEMNISNNDGTKVQMQIKKYRKTA
ncbi:MAG: tetratricopeptide repeat protein [Saprospiraceae bacterium]|nr:tetratricopeptide repeat protein [Saprospiraceae bacterium]